MRSRHRAVTAVVAGALIAACGAPNTPDGSFVGSPGGSAPPPTPLVGVKVTITMPAPSTHRRLRHDYLSSATRSLAIQLASVNGSGVTGVKASVINIVLKSPHCKAQSGATVCTTTTSGAVGRDVFTVTTYAGLNATGAVLSSGTVSANIRADGGAVGISNQLSLSLDGVIASLVLKLSPSEGERGKPTTSAVALAAFDAGGAQIVGRSDYQVPITVTVQGDANGSFRLHAGARSSSSLSVARPTSDIALHYDGNEEASSVIVQASVANSDPVSVSAPFALHGRQPAPRAGTIYVLNLGTRNGLGATVTEYAGSAHGNVAPLRTLQLSSKLYARSIAVDAGGNLYVGYFDSTFGFSPSGGAPDSGNVVAVFAPDATGDDAPKATLTADAKTSTALFPLVTSIDASGRLTTFGATTVDGNSGNAVLTYDAGSSGAAAPQHGWDFAAPTLSYAGPTGLALDAGGNFYVNGALRTTLGPSYGIFVASAADIGNPSATPARTIPWDSTTQLTPGETGNISLDSSGEIFVANAVVQENGSAVSCQGRANVYNAGASGGTTDVAPLRVLVLQGIFTDEAACASARSPLQPFFPSIQLYGTTLYAVDDFNNAVDAYPSGAGGTVKPSLTITGSSTGLNAPVAILVSPMKHSNSRRTGLP